MRPHKTIGAACVATALLSGCTASLHIGGPTSDAPQCVQPYKHRPEHLSGSLVLSAQAVPTAQLVPCLRSVPAGWTVHDFSAKRGNSRISLDLGKSDENAVTVTLTRSCDIGGARRIPTDEPGTVRFADPQNDAPGVRGTTFYVFHGGCVVYDFDVHGAAAGAAVATIARALTFDDRETVRRYVHDYSDGRVQLDPTAK
jgi:hypothetical protein